MVSRSEMARIARRYDTAMAAAMLRALGEAPGRGRGRHGRKRGRDPRYAGVRWCMRNYDPGSPPRRAM